MDNLDVEWVGIWKSVTMLFFWPVMPCVLTGRYRFGEAMGTMVSTHESTHTAQKNSIIIFTAVRISDFKES